MIKAIIRFTAGPTTTKKPIEFTNWDRVQAFAERVGILATTDLEKSSQTL